MSENNFPNRTGGRKISAFALAKIDTSVTVEIGSDDVHALRPDLTETQCQQLLRQHGGRIGRQMVIAGTLALAALLKGEDHAD
jgi:hypothetical protein